MLNKSEFENLVRSINGSLSAIASANNKLVQAKLPETGPLDSSVEEALRPELSAIRDGLASLTQARNSIILTWLRTGGSRNELSELIGVPLHQVRMMEQSIDLGVEE